MHDSYYKNKCKMQMEKTFLEFFAGVGLVRLGLEKEGWKCLFANDNNPEKVRIYKNNFGLNQIKDISIQNLDLKDIPIAALATASFPCQDLSEAGPQNGIHGPRSGVFWHFVDILHKLGASRPCMILLENVKGFLTAKKGENLILAISALNNLGYICDALMIDGKYFVPQSRPRIFVIGFLEGAITTRKGPCNEEIFKEHTFRPKQILRLMSNPSLKLFNFDLPPISQNGVKLEQILDPPEKVPQSYWFDEEEIKRHEKMIPAHHKAKVDLLKRQGGNGAFTMYRRMRKGEQKAELRFDGLAGCLRSARGGSSKQFLIVIEKGRLRMRKLTISELRRLMGLPPGFYLPNDYNAVYRALGDAVVVPAIEWVAANILNPLYNEISPTEEAILGLH